MNSRANFSQPFFQPSHSTPCRFTGWKAQFACPSGKVGWLAGRLMAIKNAGMNRFAVEMLSLEPESQVLEIGFGHGLGIQMAAEQMTTAYTMKGFIAGIDISGVMVHQAAKRNQHLIKSGLVELSQASVANIPYEFARFDRVLAVNNYQFWPNAEHNLTEIQRVLSKDGVLVLCLRLQQSNQLFRMAPGFEEQEVEEAAGLLRWVGFREIRLVKRRVGYETACLIAKK